MDKKLKSKNKAKKQTQKLSRAKLEFLKRDPEEYEELEKLVHGLRENYPKEKKIQNKFAEYLQNKGLPPPRNWPLPESFDQDLADNLLRSAAIGDYRDLLRGFCSSYSYRDHDNPPDRTVDTPGCLFTREDDQTYLRYIKENIDLIIDSLTNREPSKTLLVGIDLSRSKRDILAEVDALIDEHKPFYQGDKPSSRNAWLGKEKEILEVYDMYEEAGKTPAIQTFKYISKKVGRPLSTVKSQWYQAHEKIKGRPYDPKAKYSTEKKRRDADQLCSKCPHGAICYKKSGEWIPCQEYLKIAGLEKGIKTVEYMDDIFYSQGGRKKPHLTSDKQ